MPHWLDVNGLLAGTAGLLAVWLAFLLAYRLTLRHEERTLTDAELDAAVAGVVTGLSQDLGARLRT